MKNRAKKPVDKMQKHFYVMYFFVAVCVLAVLYTFLAPKAKIGQKVIIDDAQIMIHNGQGHQFKHGKNSIFENKTISDVKTMFMSGLSDTNNVPNCRTSKAMSEEQVANEEKIDVPDSYDWRDAYPQCVQPVYSIGRANCSASYAMSSVSAVADRICMKANKTVSLSA